MSTVLTALAQDEGPAFLTDRELADRWGVSTVYLLGLRNAQDGPDFDYLNGRCIYDMAEVLAYEAKRREED